MRRMVAELEVDAGTMTDEEVLAMVTDHIESHRLMFSRATFFGDVKELENEEGA